MSLQLMRQWVASLPPTERSLPLLHVGSVFYSPEQALYEVERGSPIGEKLQRLVEEGRFGTDLQALAKARLYILLKEAKNYKLATLSGYVIPATELAEILKKKGFVNPALKLLAQADIQLAQHALQLGKKLARGG